VLEDDHSPGTRANGWKDPANERVDTSVVGSTGLLQLSSAELGPERLLRFSLVGEYFNTTSFPVQGATNTRGGGTLALSYTPFRFLQVYGAYEAASNTNSTSGPNLIDVLGNFTLGAKAVWQFLPGLSAGVDLRALAFPGVGNQEASHYVFGIEPLAVATYSLLRGAPHLPLKVHGNLGFIFDNTKNLAPPGLDAAEQYALGQNFYHRLVFGLGVEAPLPAVSPFLEYRLEAPLGVPSNTLVSPDGSLVSVGHILPQTLSVGLKVTAVRDVTFTAAVAFALNRNVGLGVPADPPWNLFFGASYAVDPVGFAPRCPTPAPTAAAPAAPTTGQLKGVVMDARTQKPLGDAVLTVKGSGLPPVATERGTGLFLSQELAPGPYPVQVVHPGYTDKQVDVQILAGQVSLVNVALEPATKPARLDFTVTAEGKPVAAQVQLKGTQERTLAVGTAVGPQGLEVPGGHYVVNVTAPGYLAQTREVQVSDGASMGLDFKLAAEPHRRLVIVKNDKIEILQQVHFTKAQADIQADSFPLLAQVVDAIIKNDIKRVRVEGHTDNQGSKAQNLKLSQDRAQAVANFFVKSGIDASRLEVRGYGDTRPIAPNLTAKGRQLNRRVEFFILER
jgi:outer membrane protein OmpA-like peptidoglycan-associated protein